MNENEGNFPLLSYIDDISAIDKFKYFVIVLSVIVFVHSLGLPLSIWIGLLCGTFLVYYMNERSLQNLNNISDKLWEILKSPLLSDTIYFITEPDLIQWADDVSEYKKINHLEFNKMIKTIDKLLKLQYQIKIGIVRCKDNLDIFNDLRVQCLNVCHSFVHNIENSDMLDKFNYYLNQLAIILNSRYEKLIKVCKTFYKMNPITVDSKFDVINTSLPSPNDTLYDKNYNFYN